MSVSPDGKLLQWARGVLVADSEVQATFDDRVYDSHPATALVDPTYPAVTLTVVSSAPWNGSLPFTRIVTIQADVWVDGADKLETKRRLYTMSEAVARLLHRPQTHYDATTGLTLFFMQETGADAILYEADRSVWHVAKRFQAVCM